MNPKSNCSSGCTVCGYVVTVWHICLMITIKRGDCLREHGAINWAAVREWLGPCPDGKRRRGAPSSSPTIQRAMIHDTVPNHLRTARPPPFVPAICLILSGLRAARVAYCGHGRDSVVQEGRRHRVRRRFRVLPHSARCRAFVNAIPARPNRYCETVSGIGSDRQGHPLFSMPTTSTGTPRACVSYSLTMATPSTNRSGSIDEENPRPTDDPVPRPLGARKPRIPKRCPMSTDGVQHGIGIGLDRPATGALECCAAWAWPTPEGRRRSPAGSGSLYRPATLGSLRPPHGGCRHQAGRDRRQRSGILKGPLGEPLVYHRARQFQQVDREIRPTHRKVSYPLRACFRPNESRTGTDQPYVDARSPSDLPQCGTVTY